MKNRAHLGWLAAALLGIACGADPAARDGGSADAGLRDAERPADAALADASPPGDAASAADVAPLVDASAGDAADGDADGVDGAPEDAGESPAREPVVFVHGIHGSSAEFAVMKARLVADGWPADRLYAIDFPDPAWGCNVDNALIIRDTVARVRAETGARKVDLVAHSMGTISSKQYMKHLGGTDEVSTFVTLGGLHHGNRAACLNPLPVCVWQELCPTHPLLTDLNADPGAPGPTRWVSICSRSDDTADLATCHFDPAENIEVDGVDHSGANGLLEHPIVYPHVRRVLEYPTP